MHTGLRHSWPTTVAEARRLQEALRGRCTTGPYPDRLSLIAGADVSFDRFADRLFAAVVVWCCASGEVVEQAAVTAQAAFPYVPGYLSFREAPAVLAAFERLRTKPDGLLVDGQGLAHPRRFGLACHLGLLLDLPTVGCAKSRLIGEHQEPAARRGSATPLCDRGERIGTVLRTRDGVKPLFVSPGHRMDHQGSVAWTLSCCRRCRLPEPARLAHQLANELRKKSRE